MGVYDEYPVFLISDVIIKRITTQAKGNLVLM